ncbi:MAG TPA: phosphatidylglycerol lysyltransferase domain-containing protein, partial [Acidimicrobiales bacterium]|nr:phosphatidylglycerol lysyltransferase domain-containing protein [Acidimicrobiales bacterium]
AEKLVPLMAQSRRGEFERGFSMMLGRIFDTRDTGLVLCVVTGPDGAPAAMCQFVPAPGIGGYSLDLMRRDRAEHPNGLIDFALVSSIEHFKAQGCRALSLNFAAMRSILEGERGDGLTQRAERWALQKMSSFLQIETLWRFNAKYGPDWLPRYIVYDGAEHLVPAVVAIMRAESLTEMPVIGRVLVRSKRRAGLGDPVPPTSEDPAPHPVGAGRRAQD